MEGEGKRGFVVEKMRGLGWENSDHWTLLVSWRVQLNKWGGAQLLYSLRQAELRLKTAENQDCLSVSVVNFAQASLCFTCNPKNNVHTSTKATISNHYHF